MDVHHRELKSFGEVSHRHARHIPLVRLIAPLNTAVLEHSRIRRVPPGDVSFFSQMGFEIVDQEVEPLVQIRSDEP